MFLRALLVVAIVSVLLFTACSEDQAINQTAQPQKTESKQPPPPPPPTSVEDILENTSLAELSKNKLPACLAACRNRVESSCGKGCDYSCRRQCTHQECNFLNEETKNKCLKGCLARCDEGNHCKKFCNQAQKSCVQTCPKVEPSKERAKKESPK